MSKKVVNMLSMAKKTDISYVIPQNWIKELDTYALPASIKRSAITAFWHVNSPKRGILKRIKRKLE